MNPQLVYRPTAVTPSQYRRIRRRQARVDRPLAWLYAALVAALVLVPFSSIAQLVAPIAWLSIVLRVSSKRDRGLIPDPRKVCERA